MEILPPQKRVVVTGLGVVTSLGHNVPEFWGNIVAGKSGVDRVSLFDAKDYACQIGSEVRGYDPAQHMDPKEVRRNDRYTHFAFGAAKQFKAKCGQPSIPVVRDERLEIGGVVE